MKETKTCKHCQSEIPKKAKTCPICRKKQSGILKWIVIILIVLILAPVFANNSKDDVSKVNTPNSSTYSDNSSNPSTAASNDTLSFTVGETAEYKDVQITLLNVTESNGNNFNTPTDGNVFVSAEFEITNNSDKELNISSILCFDAYCDSYATNMSLSALMDNNLEQLDATIAPGKKLKGAIGYELPSDYSTLEIDVKLDVWSDKKINFIYQK